MSEVVNLVPTGELDRARDEFDHCLADVLASWSPSSFERTQSLGAGTVNSVSWSGP